MNPFEMVVLIVAITAIASIFRAKYGNGRKCRTGERDDQIVDYRDPDADRLRDEVSVLKERIHVLERIVTDGDQRRTQSLEREIDALRDKK
ncbi:hypothetical protein PQ455_11790 [Sphingomonas naphthae]|uniref:Envelope stress response membrane protein PspB n=1 Tax=Sphingomonas naphthae TaxID=1813468 RepID=A0ABY7TGG6_9SPHN|nr:hypothetical protein [Sphingomonas naphthae]WCT72318.1 hypothetical protein PQ455_11790 [Sphingomonas naphthae]